MMVIPFIPLSGKIECYVGVGPYYGRSMLVDSIEYSP